MKYIEPCSYYITGKSLFEIECIEALFNDVGSQREYQEKAYFLLKI